MPNMTGEDGEDEHPCKRDPNTLGFYSTTSFNRSEKEYNSAVKTLNSLIDEVGTNEDHPLYELLNTIGTLIHVYEEKHYSIPDCSGFEILSHLMEEHQVDPEDLPFLGPPNRVKKILNGTIPLSVRQVHVLAERFNVNPAVFL